jgi:DNA repair protein RecO (recombination protein O)
VTALRISDQPAYVLHRYDWSESSLILEVLTRQHGRIALVAKGAKRPSSNFRPVLLPLQPLRVSYGGDAEIRNLKGAEWVGGHVMPTGDALRLLARDDPHPVLFDSYADAVRVLCTPTLSLEAALRAFELVLLREIGLLPLLDLQTLSLQPLAATTRYALVPEAGLLQAAPDQRMALAGAQWILLQAALDGPAPYAATLAACTSLASEANPGVVGNELKGQLRSLLHYHCGVSVLRTRQLMLDLQTL